MDNGRFPHCRRADVLRSILALGALGTLGCRSGLGVASSRRIRLGVQMYSLKDLVERDMADAFASVRALGLEGVGGKVIPRRKRVYVPVIDFTAKPSMRVRCMRGGKMKKTHPLPFATADVV